MSRSSRRRARATRTTADYDRVVHFLTDVVVRQNAEIRRLKAEPDRPPAPVLQLIRGGGDGR